MENKYDLIAIDGEDHFGPDSTWSARVLYFERAQSFIKPNGIIVVDESWRYPKIEEISYAKSVKRLESLGPSRMGVRTTDIYQY